MGGAIISIVDRISVFRDDKMRNWDTGGGYGEC